MKNSEDFIRLLWSQTLSAKVYRRKGNSPSFLTKVLDSNLSGKTVV